MNYLPGETGILEQCLEVAALAHTFHVSQKKLLLLPYLSAQLEANAARLLTEKLLSIAIKVRFLDDRTGILKSYDRGLASIGRYFEDDNEKNTLSVRIALNKLIHHETISVRVENKAVIVVPASASAMVESRTLPLGSHDQDEIVFLIAGKLHQLSWSMELDLLILLNELCRIFELQESNPLPMVLGRHL